MKRSGASTSRASGHLTPRLSSVAVVVTVATAVTFAPAVGPATTAPDLNIAEVTFRSGDMMLHGTVFAPRPAGGRRCTDCFRSRRRRAPRRPDPGRQKDPRNGRGHPPTNRGRPRAPWSAQEISPTLGRASIPRKGEAGHPAWSPGVPARPAMRGPYRGKAHDALANERRLRPTGARVTRDYWTGRSAATSRSVGLPQECRVGRS